MRALCLITADAGMTDSVMDVLRKKRKIIKHLMVVTGRADVAVVLQGNIHQINDMVIDFKKIKNIASTETLLEIEVNMGW